MTNKVTKCVIGDEGSTQSGISQIFRIILSNFEGLTWAGGGLKIVDYGSDILFEVTYFTIELGIV